MMVPFAANYSHLDYPPSNHQYSLFWLKWKIFVKETASESQTASLINLLVDY